MPSKWPGYNQASKRCKPLNMYRWAPTEPGCAQLPSCSPDNSHRVTLLTYTVWLQLQLVISGVWVGTACLTWCCVLCCAVLFRAVPCRVGPFLACPKAGAGGFQDGTIPAMWNPMYGSGAEGDTETHGEVNGGGNAGAYSDCNEDPHTLQQQQQQQLPVHTQRGPSQVELPPPRLVRMTSSSNHRRTMSSPGGHLQQIDLHHQQVRCVMCDVVWCVDIRYLCGVCDE